MKDKISENNTGLDKSGVVDLKHPKLKRFGELIKKSERLAKEDDSFILDFFADLYKLLTFKSKSKIRRISVEQLKEVERLLKVDENSIVNILMPPIRITQKDASFIKEAIEKYIARNRENADMLLNARPDNADEETLKDDAQEMSKYIFNEKSPYELQTFFIILESLLNSTAAYMRQKMDNKKFRGEKYKEAESALQSVIKLSQRALSLSSGDERFYWTLQIIKAFRKFKESYNSAVAEYKNKKRVWELEREKTEAEELNALMRNPKRKLELLEALRAKLGISTLKKESEFYARIQNLTGTSYNPATRKRLFVAINSRLEEAPKELVQIAYRLKRQGKLK